MQIYHSIDEWRLVRKNLPSETSLGFVPTMGNLHHGHASLFTASQRENDYTIASIFVNPTQFNQQADFKHYPRTLDTDLELLENTGVDYCILPNEQTIYADGYQYRIDEHKYSQLMEGLHRPGHFIGVLTIVMKLFNIVKPHRSYFGEKDYQQYQLIRDMSDAFFMDIEVKACPTIREASGLAYSSRNNRLTAEQRVLADKFAQIFHQSIPCEQIIEQLRQIEISVDYIEEHDNRRYAAVTIGEIRLIDNYYLQPLPTISA
jgi:pantoate--beta-alanine ligase